MRGLDYWRLDELGAAAIFFPRTDERPAPPGAEDLAIPLSEQVCLAARFYVTDSAAPTVLYFHGNGEVAADHDDIAPLYHRVSLNLFVAEFRGYGQSTGTPTFNNLVADAHSTLSFFHDLLNDRGFSAHRFVMGRSLGSHPALELAANQPERLNGLIIESGAGNLQRLLQRFGADDDPGALELSARHTEKLRRISLPTLIIHGQRDDLVPVSQAHWLAETLGDSVWESLLVDGAGHNDLLWVDARGYFDAIARLTQATSD
ncbi:MAG: alpha/beta hydrolase [Pseudomonadota bacterium]